MTTKKVSFQNKSKRTTEAKEFNPDEWVSSGERAENTSSTIRFTIDLPTELHTRIKSQCAARRVKMKEVITDLLEKAFPA